MLAPGRNDLGRVLSSQPCAELAAYLQGHLQAGLQELLSRARPQAEQGAREQAPASAQQKRTGSQRKYQHRQVLPQGNCTFGVRPKESSTLLPPAGFPGSRGKGRRLPAGPGASVPFRHTAPTPAPSTDRSCFWVVLRRDMHLLFHLQQRGNNPPHVLKEEKNRRAKLDCFHRITDTF